MTYKIKNRMSKMVCNSEILGIIFLFWSGYPFLWIHDCCPGNSLKIFLKLIQTHPRNTWKYFFQKIHDSNGKNFEKYFLLNPIIFFLGQDILFKQLKILKQYLKKIAILSQKILEGYFFRKSTTLRKESPWKYFL